MLVIMDIEWIEADYRVCPTQISALRVDSSWKVIDRFDQLIQPYNIRAQMWEHMAYNGHLPDEFIAAPTAATVMNRLNNWLSPLDILCWWSESTAATFIALHRLLLKQAPNYPMRLILPAIKASLQQKGISARGSAYGIAKELAIPVSGREHCSMDDTDMIRIVCQQLMVQNEEIMQSFLRPAAEGATIHTLFGKKTAPDMRNAEYEYPYALDMTKQILHRAECEKINFHHEIRLVSTMNLAFRTLSRPCSCCKEVYWDYSRRQADINIQKMQISYVYSEHEGRKLFHRPDCIHVKRMPYPMIHGAVRYDTCINHGYEPCGWCKPKPRDEKEPKHVYMQPRIAVLKEIPSVSKKKVIAGDAFNATRTLSRFEQNAIKRHAAAVKERAAMPNNLTGVENHDAFVLAQSGYAFWAAEGYQTFHLRNCPKLAHLSHLHGYARFAEAKHFGLSPCKLCKPTGKHDITASVPIYQQIRKNETVEEIDGLCTKYGWQYCRDEREYRIETTVGIWRLELETVPVRVLHINKVKTPGNETIFHKQERLFLSMTDTIEYIRRHDSSLMEKERKRKEADKPGESCKVPRNLSAIARLDQEVHFDRTCAMAY